MPSLFHKLDQEPKEIITLSASDSCFNSLRHWESMWFVSKKTDISTTPEQLWNLLIDIEGWSDWNHDIAAATLEFPNRKPRSGARGVLFNPKQQGFVLVDLETNHYFAYDCQIIGSTVHHFFEIVESQEGIILEAGIVVTGWSALLQRALLHDQFDAELSRLVKRIKNRLEGFYQL